MKTISPKDAFKLFLFVLILFSAKTFSFPRLPNSDTSECVSRMGTVRKMTNNKVTSSASKSNAVLSKTCLKKNVTSSLKTGMASN